MKIWTAMSEAQKQLYIDYAAKDRVRYINQMEDLLTKGYFIMPDGSKSSEHHRADKPERVRWEDLYPDESVVELIKK